MVTVASKCSRSGVRHVCASMFASLSGKISPKGSKDNPNSPRLISCHLSLEEREPQFLPHHLNKIQATPRMIVFGLIWAESLPVNQSKCLCVKGEDTNSLCKGSGLPVPIPFSLDTGTLISTGESLPHGCHPGEPVNPSALLPQCTAGRYPAWPLRLLEFATGLKEAKPNGSSILVLVGVP